MKKFEHIASVSTGKVIINARKEPSPFVYPQDFPKQFDVDFLLFHQVSPYLPPTARVECKGVYGLCCKHCACANYAGEVYHHGHTGVYSPMDVDSLADASFSPRVY